MNKHTPGPWQTLAEECDRPYIRVRGTQVGGRYKIANVLTPVYEGVHSKEADETRANASLIAASPDLLQALDNLRRAAYWIVEGGEFAHWVNDKLMPLAAAKELDELAEMVRAAQATIAKVKGEQT